MKARPHPAVALPIVVAVACLAALPARAVPKRAAQTIEGPAMAQTSAGD